MDTSSYVYLLLKIQVYKYIYTWILSKTIPAELWCNDGAQDAHNVGQAVRAHVVELVTEVVDLGARQVGQDVRDVVLCSYRYHCNSV